MNKRPIQRRRRIVHGHRQRPTPEPDWRTKILFEQSCRLLAFGLPLAGLAFLLNSQQASSDREAAKQAATQSRIADLATAVSVSLYNYATAYESRITPQSLELQTLLLPSTEHKLLYTSVLAVQQYGVAHSMNPVAYRSSLLLDYLDDSLKTTHTVWTFTSADGNSFDTMLTHLDELRTLIADINESLLGVSLQEAISPPPPAADRRADTAPSLTSIAESLEQISMDQKRRGISKLTLYQLTPVASR